jgi:hypothetical protein
MANLSPGLLEDYSGQLTQSLQTIIHYLQGSTCVSTANGAPGNVNRAKGDILKILGSLQTLLTEPKDLVCELYYGRIEVPPWCLSKSLQRLQILRSQILCLPYHSKQHSFASSVVNTWTLTEHGTHNPKDPASRLPGKR